MKRKRLSRIAVCFFSILFAVLLLFVLGTWLCHLVKTDRELELLKEKGYFNPVSVGDYSLNVVQFGNGQGGRTIVGLAGLGMSDFPVAMRRMTAQLERDNMVVFVDRAGYGLSDDNDREMTLETIVEDYRTALKNAAIEPPYVLMAHSIGGVYATWWASRFPGEIEAVVLIDGTPLSETVYDDEPDCPVTIEDRALAFLARLGFSRYVLRSEHYLYPDGYSEEEQLLGDALELRSMGSLAPVSESSLRQRNVRTAFAGIVPNDIPKLYICSSWGAQTKDDLLEVNRWMNRQIEKNRLDMPLRRTEYDDETAAEILNRMEEFRRTILKPYAEKMGNCKITLLFGDHMIYEQKPDACGKLIKDFLDRIPSAAE